MNQPAQRWVYLNGEYVREADAKISIFDSALMFGDMIFEMTRSFNKKQFRLREHLERLALGMKIFHIPLDLSVDQLEARCLEVIEKNEPAFSKTDEHRLMINVSRGPLSIYHKVFDRPVGPTVVIADFPLKWTVVGMGALFDKGINAVVPSQRAIPAALMDPKIKNRSRMFYQTANIELSRMKGENNWALLLDPDGFIAEGTGCNFFIVKDKKIFTPEGRNILRGISRNYIFELAETLGISCREKNLEPYDVYAADEAFVTATPFCALPVTHFNFTKIGSGAMGAVTRQLLDVWGKNVGVDIVRQIKAFNEEVQLASAGPVSTPYQFKTEEK
ncbi:MAG: aminotransferase class IV [Candidatus Omnitrophica bacterium]|nr:aminotransferase class IV [Candidatus Omnitrophota bacterium]